MIFVREALETDFPRILEMARSYDLDLEDVSYSQFLVAVQEETIVGFGRLRQYPGCVELATVGVEPSERSKGVGGLVVQELIRRGPEVLYVTCVIPGYFKNFGFEEVKEYPSVLRKKVDFCKSYDYREDQVFVMKRVRT